jgi:tetratricopeptide (TPR) repeat protein
VDLVRWLEERPLEEIEHTNVARSIVSAAARMALGDLDSAMSLLAASETALRSEGGFWWAEFLPLALRIALAGDDHTLAERLADTIEPRQPLSQHAIVAAQALLAEAHGDYETASAAFAEAASRWHDFAVVYEEAYSLLGQGRCLVALGRAPEAAPVLEQARAIFARLEAKPALEETDAALARVGASADESAATAAGGSSP